MQLGGMAIGGGVDWNVGAATSGTWIAPYNANVIWQNTSSNATYCSASAALGGAAMG